MANDATTTMTTSIDPPLWFYRRILQSSLAEKYPDSRETRLHHKTLCIQSSHFKFRIQNLWRHDQTKEFLFRIFPLVQKQNQSGNNFLQCKPSLRVKFTSVFKRAERVDVLNKVKKCEPEITLYIGLYFVVFYIQ